MPPQTLQSIENGKTKSVSLAARRMLAPVLQVREDQLLLPIGMPFDPEPGERPPINDLIYEALTTLINQMVRQFDVATEVVSELREIKQLLQAYKPPAPPRHQDNGCSGCSVVGSDAE
jgi:transcriptional regulator with XRE-family HTH domain